MPAWENMMLANTLKNSLNHGNNGAGYGAFSAAEADIMRLIAVLALCLMLLFAAEQHFSESTSVAVPVEVEPAFVAISDPTQTPVEIVPPPAVAETVPDPVRPEATETPPPETQAQAPAPAAPQLYFSSDVALLSLLTRGRLVVYVEQDSAWRRVGMDGLAATQDPPDMLYKMRADTVPALLREHVGTTATQTPITWSIWLDPQIASQIGSQLASGFSGDLVIEGSGRVQPRAREQEVGNE
jgi:hypothetical protein